MEPVAGEAVTDNNQATYTVIFGSAPVSGTSAAPMRVAYLGPRGTFTEDALREAIGGEEVEAQPKPSVYAAIIAVQSGEADRALVPFENSIEGVGQRHPRHPRLRRAGGDDRRRARPADPPLPDRPRADPPGANRGRALAPAGERPVRPLHPREPPGGRGPGGLEHRRGGPPGERARGPWAALGAASAASSTGPPCFATGSRTSPTTSPASSGSPPPGPRPRERTLAHLAGLRRARRRPARRPGRGAAGVLRPGREPDPDRVAPAARRAGPLHVLRRSRGRGRAGRRSPRRSRSCAERRSRSGCWAAIRSPAPPECQGPNSRLARIARDG